MPTIIDCRARFAALRAAGLGWPEALTLCGVRAAGQTDEAFEAEVRAATRELWRRLPDEGKTGGKRIG